MRSSPDLGKWFTYSGHVPNFYENLFSGSQSQNLPKYVVYSESSLVGEDWIFKKAPWGSRPEFFPAGSTPQNGLIFFPGSSPMNFADVCGTNEKMYVALGTRKCTSRKPRHIMLFWETKIHGYNFLHKNYSTRNVEFRKTILNRC